MLASQTKAFVRACVLKLVLCCVGAYILSFIDPHTFRILFGLIVVVFGGPSLLSLLENLYSDLENNRRDRDLIKDLRSTWADLTSEMLRKTPTNRLQERKDVQSGAWQLSPDHFGAAAGTPTGIPGRSVADKMNDQRRSRSPTPPSRIRSPKSTPENRFSRSRSVPVSAAFPTPQPPRAHQFTYNCDTVRQSPNGPSVHVTSLFCQPGNYQVNMSLNGRFDLNGQAMPLDFQTTSQQFSGAGRQGTGGEGGNYGAGQYFEAEPNYPRW